MLPQKEFNVFRVYTSDTLVENAGSFGGSWNKKTITNKYEWFTENYKFPLLVLEQSQYNLNGTDYEKTTKVYLNNNYNQIVNTNYLTNKGNWSIYPNPCVNQLYVQKSTNEITFQIQIFSSEGILVQSNFLSPKENIIQLSDFKSGLYFITFTNEITKEPTTLKFIKL